MIEAKEILCSENPQGSRLTSFSVSRDASGFWLEFARFNGPPRCLGPFTERSAAKRSGIARGWRYIGR